MAEGREEAFIRLRPVLGSKIVYRGAAGSWSLSNLAPRMLQADFKPGFYVKHFVKDLKIATESAEKTGLRLPGPELAKKLYDRPASEGLGGTGTRALIRVYEEM